MAANSTKSTKPAPPKPSFSTRTSTASSQKPGMTYYNPSLSKKLQEKLPAIGTKEYIIACENNFDGMFDSDVTCKIGNSKFDLDLLPHHRFPINYLTADNTIYNSELVYHNVGTGKTRVGLGLAIRAIQQGMHVYVVLPSTLQNVWDAELLSDKILSNVERENFQDVLKHIKSNMTYIKINDTKNFVGNMQKHDYSNSMMIIDESHSFISMIHGNEKNKSSQLKDLFYGSRKPKKLALLTATPLINSPIELAKTLNILTGDPNYFNLHTFKNDYIDEVNLKIKDTALVAFSHKMMGYISYFKNEIDREHYPRMIGTINEVTLAMETEQSSGVESIYDAEQASAFKKSKARSLNVDDDVAGNFFMKSRMASIFYHPEQKRTSRTSHRGQQVKPVDQLTDASKLIAQWNEIYETLGDFETVFGSIGDDFDWGDFEDQADAILALSDVHNTLIEDEISSLITSDVPIDDNRESILSYIGDYFQDIGEHMAEMDKNSLVAFTVIFYNIIDPDNTFDLNDEETILNLSNVDTNNLINNIMDIIENISKFANTDIPENIQRDIVCEEMEITDVDISQFIGENALHIEKWSIKFHWIIKKLKEYKDRGEKCLIYSYFIKESLNPLSTMLKMIGYHNILEPRSGSGPGYLMVNGDLSIDLRKDKLEISNAKINDDGSKCAVILGSGVMSEGFTLKSTRHLILVEPFWNMSKFQQVIGRLDRYMSHDSLDPSKRNYDVTILLAEPNNPDAFIERQLYDKAIKKNKLITSVLNVCIDRKNLKFIEKGSIDIFKYSTILDDDILKVYNDKSIVDKHIFAPRFKLDEHMFILLKIPDNYYVKCSNVDTLKSSNSILTCDINVYRGKKCYFAYKIESIKANDFLIENKQPDAYIFLIKDPKTGANKYTLVKTTDIPPM